MKNYSLRHLSVSELTLGLSSSIASERTGTSRVLAYIAEFDRRRLYRDAGYPSMSEYCKRELHLSESAAYRRIMVARAARRFPTIFAAIEQGRVHLAGVLLLRPHLERDTVDELLAMA